MPTSAIFYVKSGYDTTGQRLMGRQAAGEGFLRVLAEHGSEPRLYCYTQHRAGFDEFSEQVRGWSKRPLEFHWVKDGDTNALAEVGTLYRPDLVLSPLFWRRRFASQRAYSICGVTHTTATHHAIRSIAELLTTPAQPWDALICTSLAVKKTVDLVHESYGEYLEKRVGSRPQAAIQLPIIPLGVDLSRFPEGAARGAARAEMRAKLGVKEGEPLIMYIGRLVFYEKAHPVPMYLALERAAQAIGKKIHLVQAGWFEQTREEDESKEAAKLLCPNVETHFVDGRDPNVRRTIWAASDVFVSLSDNVQETFGLTPIEAMAAGLPVVVSDWNGYQETVREGVDGFRVPTLIPPPGGGIDWAEGFSDESLSYQSFIGYASMCTAVDIEKAAQAIERLVKDPSLAQQMGENGKKHARDTFDWRVVIRQYEDLWRDLGEKRKAAREWVPVPMGSTPNPLCDDVFRSFGHYATAVLSPETILTSGPPRSEAATMLLRSSMLATLGSDERAKGSVVDEMLDAVAKAGKISVADLASRFPSVPRHVLLRTVVHLTKFDWLKVHREGN